MLALIKEKGRFECDRDRKWRTKQGLSDGRELFSRLLYHIR